MPRPRTPMGKAALTGAIAKDPQRYRNRSEPETKPLGKAPKFLTKEQRDAWDSFAAEWSWLTEGDRAGLIALSQMRAKIEDPNEGTTAALYTAYRLMLSEHGGTPVSRSKVFQPKDDDEEDPFASFGKPN